MTETPSGHCAADPVMPVTVPKAVRRSPSARAGSGRQPPRLVRTQHVLAVEARDALQEKLNASDVELQKKQQELKEARARKVGEKVIIYRDRIKDSATAQCVKESGILDLYDATVK